VAYLTSEPIGLGPLLDSVQSPARGGITSFLGTVRDHQGGRAVLRLDYSAYVPMAEAEIARIVAEAESRWDVGVAVQHRIGELQIGDVAVAIAVASGHRDEAFVACRYVIEELKRRVPIWKREYFADGTVDWVGGEAGKMVGKMVGGEAGRRGSGEEGKQGTREAQSAVEVGARDSDTIGS
jgi:molybdopterin synthase catalytic subunit